MSKSQLCSAERKLAKQGYFTNGQGKELAPLYTEQAETINAETDATPIEKRIAKFYVGASEAVGYYVDTFDDSKKAETPKQAYIKSLANGLHDEAIDIIEQAHLDDYHNIPDVVNAMERSQGTMKSLSATLSPWD